MVEAVKEYLKRNKKLLYWVRCYKNRKDSSFVNRVLAQRDEKELFIIRSNGNRHKGCTIYDIEIREKSGFFCMYRHILHALYVADRFNFRPYIRINHTYYNNTFERDDNVFEYFFIQPSHLGLQDINEAYNIIEYNFGHIKWVEDECETAAMFTGGYDINDNLINVLAEIVKKYITLKPGIIKQLRQDMDSLITEESVIALHYRGNAYKIGAYGHPVCLEVEDYYPYIDECIELGYKKFFLATDDNNALEKLIFKYGSRIVYYKDTLRSTDGIDVFEHKQQGSNGGFKMGYDVLRDMYTMAKCSGLICGNSQVTYASRIEKRKQGQQYKYLRIIDKGFYKKNDKKARGKYEKQENFDKRLQNGACNWQKKNNKCPVVKSVAGDFNRIRMIRFHSS